MGRFAQVLIERLQWTRLRLLDVYGDGDVAEHAAAGAMTPRAVPRRRPRARHRRHVDAHARAASTGDGPVDRAGPVRDGLRVRRSARCRSRSAARPSRRGPLVLTVRAVGAVTHAICASEPGAVLGLRGPFGNVWPVDAAAGGDVVVVAGGIGLAPLRPVVLRRARRAARDYGAVTLLYGARTPRRPPLHRRSSTTGAPRSTSRSRSTRPTAAGAAGSASCRSSSPARRSGPRRRPRSSAGPR